ncbi:hypothetical protein [Haloferula sp. BvORR071]|uniref:hypothetical protein n=1 Tax=Haloferula sp. BvORR071 TaxID=1396141 RepID=UPI000558455C|nr:hypothetical protein [Haloferula sp. BvORR071]
MKRRNAIIRPAGILCWSTACLIAGLGLSGCERSYTATAQDEQMAKTQKEIEQMDALKKTLTAGDVPNNFKLEGVGYYHAGAHDFFPEPYGTARDGKWFMNGVWQTTPPPVEEIPPSRPSPEALKKVLAALEKEQKEDEQGGSGGGTIVHNHHSGFGMGNALLMYWMLSGNRNSFTPTAGFNRAATQAPAWQGEIESERSKVSAHAAANPGYRRMVEQSKASGSPVTAGKSVRGGFGSSRSSSGSSKSFGS